ncbi:pilus assembly PilX family protein [Legionella pneumophila]|uniref:Type IV pilus assembly protein PilX n=1 Tax=Legionella pneumophila subsp. pascullei TaxID=91890 RepID=A0AAX2IT19_LEGPN|nr:pilus assembly protein [Legionella pneumophila]AMP90643.1 pilus assembly protein PilX [Legionella pneumophila subsp. pascullei]AMP91666.1 pilus assembly protein PilX [Legionella pneumophila subsp. pascullei]AMP94652.1 pilus assembly protein PilX [Legionella pneumophila subsp. pascullei]SQG89472.1 type IV pilus assembly protein PilX [Legionella pneumophila subsp. pascullei]VEH04778.1 type IV pilus assembly protein PilX [Legionella pneumophila subsp. pascullei]
MNVTSTSQYSKQQGYVLITSLVLMSMLTVLALTQISQNTSQTRIATNATDSEISFEKTEGAVNEAINLVINGTYNPQSFLATNNGMYLFDQSASTPLWKTINWSSGSAVINSFQGNTGAQASYFLEKLPSVIMPGQNMKKPSNVYRITARSAGASGDSSVLIQSTIQIQQ